MSRAFSRFLPAALVMTIASALWNPGICAAGQEEERGRALLVSTAWLAGHLNDRSLVLIHIGPKEEFEAGHIPGAQFLSLKVTMAFENLGDQPAYSQQSQRSALVCPWRKPAEPALPVRQRKSSHLM